MRNIVQLLSGMLLLMMANVLLAQTGPGFGGVPAPNAGIRTPTDPGWPQSFDLHGRVAAQYRFSVRRPGAVTIMVQWQGDPITIVVTKPDGQKAYVNAQGSPGSVPLNATAGDVRMGAVWQVEIYPTLTKVERPGSDPNANHHAKGSVSVQVPNLAAAPLVGQAPPPPAPRPRPGPPQPAQDNGLTPESHQTCFAYAAGSGAPANVQCSWRRDWCEEYVRTRTVEGGTRYPNMVILVACSPAPLYCYSYNNGNSGVCFTDGNECVNNRNSFANQQRGVSVGYCKDYTDGRVRN